MHKSISEKSFEKFQKTLVDVNKFKIICWNKKKKAAQTYEILEIPDLEEMDDEKFISIQILYILLISIFIQKRKKNQKNIHKKRKK